MSYERSIKEAFDRISGTILKADEIFENKKDAFKIRKQFHKNNIDLYCCECEQKLNVSTSKYDRLHFKHEPKAKPCLLKDSNLSTEESEKIYAIYRSKESDRHKELKNKIAERLSRIARINSISIDDKFIIDSNERRKPDVYCKYLDKELVFEIQLSDLSLKYILYRYEFYKRNKIYLIWILDNFDVHGQSQTERDIKYLTEFQNFFKLDEDAIDFRLICKYKHPYLTKDNQLMTKWTESSVSLEQIKFSPSSFQIYYFNFDVKLKLLEREQVLCKQKQDDEEKLRIEERRKNFAVKRVNSIIDDLRNAWQDTLVNFGYIKQRIERLDEFELTIFNHSDAFKPKNGQPKFHLWFSIAKKEHIHFLEFILDCEYIKIDLNKKSLNNESLLTSLFKNRFLDNKVGFIKKILKRGYIFLKEDEVLLSTLEIDTKHIESTIVICTLANQLSNKELVDELFKHVNLLCIIESAKRDQIVGFSYKSNEWIAFANNALQFYKEYWIYIQIAFKYYGLWDKLLALDKNRSYKIKLEEHYRSDWINNTDFEKIFIDLYPELN